MKAILEFDLDNFEDRLSHKRAVNATNAYLVLHCLTNDVLRKLMKYDELSEKEYEIVDKINSELVGLLDRYDVNLNDLE